MTSSASNQRRQRRCTAAARGSLGRAEATQHAYAACCSADCCCYTAASALPRPKICIFFNFKTLLVLQFLIEFANIWTQYCPSTYASTHVGFFWFVS